MVTIGSTVADQRIGIALGILMLGYPVVALTMSLWLLVVSVRGVRNASIGTRRVLAQLSGPGVVWLILNVLLGAFWLAYAYYVGMGVGHASDKDIVAPEELLVLLIGALVAYAVAVGLLIRWAAAVAKANVGEVKAAAN